MHSTERNELITLSKLATKLIKIDTIIFQSSVEWESKRNKREKTLSPPLSKSKFL